MPVVIPSRDILIVAFLAALAAPAPADDFVPDDVLVCPAAADVVDPEIEPGGSTMVFNNTSGDLLVTRLRADGTLGLGGCKGRLIDTGFVWIVLGVTLGFGLIGFADDYAKVSKSNHKGVPGRVRLGLGFLIALAASVAAMLLHPADLTGQLALPVFKEVLIDLGWFFVPFAMFVIVGAANSVNLTDGLDGLAIMPVMIAAGTLGLISYFVGNLNFAEYLGVHYVPGTGELLVFTAALAGGGLGFLWYNAPPAAVFMGDTGSLALGGALGAIAVAIKHEIVLAIVGGLFVVEALSVIIQVAYFKRTGKRVFLMAPIHHHFEKRGWAEPQIVIRFWIISLVLALIGLATLKIR